MNKLLALLILTLTIGVFGTQSITAQTKEEKKAAKKADKEKSKQERQDVERKMQFETNNPVRIIKNYDKFSDVTTVRLNSIYIQPKTLAAFDSLILAAEYSYQGNTVKEPEKLRLIILSQRTYSFEDELILFVDGERLSLGSPTVEESVTSRKINSFYLSQDTLTRIANAKSVEGKIGNYDLGEFELIEWHLNALKTLLNYEKSN